MTADQFTDIAQKLVGRSRGWQNRIAVKLDLTQATISRYATGTQKIPVQTALALEALLDPSRPHTNHRRV